MFSAAALEGQVLELHFLQVHLWVQRPERPDGGGGGDVVALVLRSSLPPSSGSSLQGPL